MQRARRPPAAYWEQVSLWQRNGRNMSNRIDFGKVTPASVC